jgi:salicylate biosynthesis isochorismate synthase
VLIGVSSTAVALDAYQPDASGHALAQRACADAIALARLQSDGHAWAIAALPVALPQQPIAPFVAAAGRMRSLGWSAESDQWLLGIGDAAAIACSGPGRIMTAAQAAASLSARVVVAAAPGAPPLPCFLHALSFEDRGAESSHWGSRLPGYRIILPRRLLWRQNAQSGFMICAVMVNADSHTDAAVNELFTLPPLQAAKKSHAWPPAADDFENLVEDAVALIRDGAMRKVVLARAVDVAVDAEIDAGAALGRLRSLCDIGSTIYSYDLEDGSVFLGATPELLFNADGTALRTIALAGSSRRSASEPEDAALAAAMHASTKERKEHGVVVEHIANVLRPRCAPFEFPRTPNVRVLPKLLHLQTEISAELLTKDYFELLGALHPTPAVCGLPTPIALNYIARHEHLQRGLYAGVLGWSTPGAARFVVALRGGIVRGAQARLFAGAGIVETSEAASELAETELKLRLMRQALGG